MVLAMTVVLGAVLFMWGRRLHGAAGGILALALFTLDPNILAHSRLATVDMAETLFFFLAVASMVAWFHAPTRWRLALAGLACGAALATKFTAVLLAPIGVGLALVTLILAPPARRRTLSLRLAGGLMIMAVTALLVINTAYLFGGSLKGLGDYRFRSQALNMVQQPWLDWLPVPLPADFVRGFDAQQVDLETGDFPNYFNGRWSQQGWWYYYPVAWLLKTPLSLVALLLAAAGLAAAEALEWRRRHHATHVGLPPEDSLRRLSAWAVGLGIAIPMIAACFFNRLDIGVRYILPIYPFLFLSLAGLGRLCRRREPVAALAASSCSASRSPFGSDAQPIHPPAKCSRKKSISKRKRSSSRTGPSRRSEAASARVPRSASSAARTTARSSSSRARSPSSSATAISSDSSPRSSSNRQPTGPQISRICAIRRPASAKTRANRTSSVSRSKGWPWSIRTRVRPSGVRMRKKRRVDASPAIGLISAPGQAAFR